MTDISDERTASTSLNINNSFFVRKAVARSVDDITKHLDKPFQSITITRLEKSAAFSALSVTVTWLDGTETSFYFRPLADT